MTIYGAIYDAIAMHAAAADSQRAIESLCAASVPVAAAPFPPLPAALTSHFDGNVTGALAEDGPEAARMVEQIVAEHVRAARVRLARPTPTLDWADHIALTQALPTIARRAADLRFVEILQMAVRV